MKVHQTFVAMAMTMISFVFVEAPAHAQANAIPLINQPLVPSGALPRSSALTVFVNGTKFLPGVTWNGSAHTTKFVPSSQLTAQTSAADIATAQITPITVTNTGTLHSRAKFFQVAVPAALSVNFVTTSIPTGTTPYGITVGDFNEDGRLDLAVVNNGGNSITILLGNGDGSFAIQPAIAVGTAPTGIVAADFNGDGKVDLAVANYSSNNISILLGNGDGTFEAPAAIPCDVQPESIEAADFNGDGKLDLVTANEASSTVSVLLGNGDGTFQPYMGFATGQTPLNATVGDFNGDGHLDLAVSTFVAGVSILLGNGDGTFQGPVNYSPGSVLQYVTVADFNGDGKLDIAATLLNQSDVEILQGNGDGTFQPAVVYPTASSPLALTAADFNGDSKIDLAVSTIDDVSLLLGNGDGTFQSHLDFPIPPGIGGLGIAAGDFNNDSLVDIGATNLRNNLLSILLQTTLSLSSGSIGFASQGVLTTTTQSITLTNTGGTAIPINSITITGANADVFAESSTCGNSIPAGAACIISVSFTPKNQHAFTATLNISDGAVGSPQVIPLVGTGMFARYAIKPAGLHFGNQIVGSTSNPRTLQMRVRIFAQAVSSVSIAGTNASDFAQTNTCVPVVQPGSSCMINVTFTPSNTGTRSAKVVLKGGFEFGPVTVPVNGTGTN